MKTTFKFLAITFTAVAFVFTSCKKKEDEKPTNYNAAADNSKADNAFAGIWKQISTVTDSSNNLRTPAGCATASITPFDAVTWPKTVTIDFGTVNCTGSDGNNRRGIITAVFTGPYLDSGSVITVSLTNYYHNDYKVTGTQTITNQGNNSAGHLVYKVVVSGATVTNPSSGAVSTWNTTQYREFYAGYTTSFNIYDDVYMITGNASGVSEAGEGYSINIMSPLRVNVGCPWIVSGDLTLTLDDYPTYPIDFNYGSGACDANATAVLNGTTYNIVMS